HHSGSVGGSITIVRCFKPAPGPLMAEAVHFSGPFKVQRPTHAVVVGLTVTGFGGCEGHFPGLRLEELAFANRQIPAGHVLQVRPHGTIADDQHRLVADRWSAPAGFPVLFLFTPLITNCRKTACSRMVRRGVRTVINE